MMETLGRRESERSRGPRVSGEVNASIRLFARELLTLAGTNRDPFGCPVVTQTAVFQLEELLMLIVTSGAGADALKRAPLWQSAGWVVSTVCVRLAPYAGDPAVDPVLEAARAAGVMLN